MAQASDNENTSVVPNNVENTPLGTDGNQTNTENKDEMDLYTFRLDKDGTYYQMNDLKYFLRDTSVQSIILYGGSYSDLSPLAKLHNLEELDIDSNDHITDISPLATLTKLKKLTITNCDNIESIESISQLSNLTYLVLYYRDTLYKELTPLHELETLISSPDVIPELDFYFLETLVNLKELSIIYASIYEEGILNIEILQNLIKLERLTIDILSEVDISWINKLQRATQWCLTSD